MVQSFTNGRAAEKPVPVPPPPPAPHKVATPLIVAIGTSAGGLEALEHFLKQVPVNNGMAFVVIQHLDPSRKGMLPELLQRVTAMKVLQATNGMQVKPDCVYVIPPNKDLSLWHGMLQVQAPTRARGVHLPIDHFFRALAEDRREAAIAIVLSGMGSDGTLGLEAIKEYGGFTLVQDPASSKFDAMPRSAINAGLADVIAPADQLPGKLMVFQQQMAPADSASRLPGHEGRTAFDQVMLLLRERTGNDFSQYKENTIVRRIERRMGLHRIGAIGTYLRYLQENPQEADLLYKELLIGVTRFFRDKEAWDAMAGLGIPALLAAHPGGKVLRAWAPACSSGEEAYSLAMVFQEVLAQHKPMAKFSLQVFATDLDQDAIEHARRGVYPAAIAADVSPERLARFFVADANNFRIGKAIREMVILAPQNLITDPPFTKLDIVTCRNVLIYLNADLQARLIPLFHYALVRDGLLMLGNAESTGAGGLFEPLGSKTHLYRRCDNPDQAVQVEFLPAHRRKANPTMADQKTPRKAGDLQHQADQFLLQHFTPAAVIVTTEGDIVYICGRTGNYLEPAAGKANWNIYAMVREGLRHDLLAAFRKVIRHGGMLSLEHLHVVEHDGMVQSVNVTVQLIDNPERLRGMVAFVFTDLAVPVSANSPAPADGEAAPNPELRRAQQEIQSIHEEMQTSQEELISTNEELQSTNEELQSTNEELTTSKEEMQSLNEELQTVNAELQSKVDDLSVVNNDMKNLLNSIDIAIVFLDSGGSVRRYTTQASSLFQLIPGDVGRPLTDIVNSLVYPPEGLTLLDETQQVLRTQVVSERQLTTRNGRWFRVRIMPYRTIENKSDGLVLTFTDITESKTLERTLRQSLHDKAH
jgi:two-component system CheB/CheR fusion protein